MASTQNGNFYQLRIYNVFGVLKAIIEDFESLEYARKVNEVGFIRFTLPDKYRNLLQPENRVEVWRSVGGGPLYLEGETIWFLRKPVWSFSSDSKYTYSAEGFDAVTLLKRRVVIYYADSAQAKKTAAADDMMKAIMRENFGSLSVNRLTGGSDAASQARDISASYLSTQADVTLAPSITLGFAYREVLGILQDIAAASATGGTYLAFDVVATGGTPPLEFRTYTGQRGTDHSALASGMVLLDPEQGNLADAQLAFDYTNEANFVYAGGQETGADRVFQSSSDATRIALSPYNRIESFTDSRNNSDANGVQADANAQLRAMRPQILFNATLLDTPRYQYGLDYKFGDVLLAQYLGYQIACRVEAIHVSVNGGVEAVDTKLQSVVS